MTDVKAAEPSIEEILASIRKIISDDDEPSPETSTAVHTLAPVPAPVMEEPEEDEVLELTDIVLEMPAVTAAPEPDAPFADPEPAAPPEPQPVAQIIEPQSPEPNEPKTDEGTMSAEEPADDRQRIVSDSTFAAAAGTLSRLTHSESNSSGGKSVEDITRDLLRPMLKAWLDQNLPGLVEKLVERELKKISRKAEDV